MQGLAHVEVGDHKFTNLDYADDIALPAANANDLTACLLSGFSDASRTMGLNASWPKTKVQSLGTGPPALGVSVSGQPVEHVYQFCYLGSIIDSAGSCRPDALRRIGNASSSINSEVWSQTKLSLATKLRIYQTCIVPILLYGFET